MRSATNRMGFFIEFSFAGLGRRYSIPFVFGSRQQSIDERRYHGESGQRPQKPISPVQTKLDIGGAARDENREQDSSRSRIRRRFGVGDHIESEKQQRAALQLL